MFSRFMPREGKFFDLFNEHAALIVEGSRELAALMASGDDLMRTTRARGRPVRKDAVPGQQNQLHHLTYLHRRMPGLR